MNKLLLFLGTILTINCYSQISFEKGYYINNSDQKIECLIKNNDWAKNPTDFKYKASENDDVKTIGIESVKEFGIYNDSKYLRKKVNVDKSSGNIDNLSSNKNPIYNEEQLFLKVLVEGKGNLYQGGNPKKYFFNIDNSTIEQLVYKNYKDFDNQIKDNNEFRKQLWENLKCSTIKTDDLMKLDYKESGLITVFCEYNKCSNSEFINYKAKKGQQQKDLFNLTLRPRLNNSSLVVQNLYYNTGNIDFGKKIGFGFGAEAEFILPFNKNKWAILLEPTYQSFNVEKTIAYSYYKEKTEIKYTSVEIPLGVRHYFFLNNNSKVFVNASFVFDIAFGSSIEYKTEDNIILNTLSIDNSQNFAVGIGYKLYDKYCIEMRFYSNRELLSEQKSWNSEYKTASIILGYTIF